MGNKVSVNKIGFADIQYIFNCNRDFIIINTLLENEQECIIEHTVTPENEIEIINKAIGKTSLYIVIYGKNCTDDTIYKKYHALCSLGFTNVFVYPGGLFEWLCLQDIYGSENFPTTTKEIDILKYKPPLTLNKLLLEDRNID